MNALGDVRGFYAALGIDLPGWGQANATVRCFADPDAHAHDDHDPSCSVSLEHGAWRCWGCGAQGGAYDAAVAAGHTPASAIDLLIEHGLAQRREPPVVSAARRGEPARTRSRAAGRPSVRLALRVTDTDVREWQQALFSKDGERWRERLARQRLWSDAVMHELELGHDGFRVTIPIRDATGHLRGVLRYQPNAPTHKMLAVPGTRLGLIPHPERERSRRIMLVEGPPDMIATRSHGWPAIAVPGDHAWRPEWATLLTDRVVTVVMDSDAPGRAAAQRIAADLRLVADVRVVDLAPGRDDGFDLTDWPLSQP
ncbi:MAG: toprim domain-containing protein, partial [Solirubrobacteraceae bacterium]